MSKKKTKNESISELEHKYAALEERILLLEHHSKVLRNTLQQQQITNKNR